MKRVFCTLMLLVAACSSDPTVATPLADGGAPEGSTPADEASVDAGAPQWRPVLQNLDGALLSIWGSSPTDVWAVGGPLGNTGFESLAVRYNGTIWSRARTGGTDSYWWVHGTSATDVWLVGERGRITHWDGSAFKEMTSGTDATLFGVWAASPADVWAVGGTPESEGATNTVVLHYDGASWKPEAIPETKHVAFFKVWGSSANDIYVVGDQGVIWHRVQGTWRAEGAGLATGRLTTVHGCSATEIYAVGGRDLLVSDGTTWRRADNIDPLFLVNDLNGVSCGEKGVVIVGGGSLKLRLARRSGAIDPTKRWETDFGSEPLVDLHGAWADPTGAFWGAGGQFVSPAHPGAKRQGVIARYATDVVSTVLIP